jgi:hypothetical protein
MCTFPDVERRELLWSCSAPGDVAADGDGEPEELDDVLQQNFLLLLLCDHSCSNVPCSSVASSSEFESETISLPISFLYAAAVTRSACMDRLFRFLFLFGISPLGFCETGRCGGDSEGESVKKGDTCATDEEACIGLT